MNYNAAKAMLPLSEDIRDYFGLGRRGGSCFNHRRPFCPGVGPVSISPPKQLTSSARQGGVFIEMDHLGGPDLLREFIAAMDGIDHRVMVEATDYLWHVRPEFHDTLMAVTNRSAYSSKAEIARGLGLTPEGMRYRLTVACEIMLEFLDGWLEREVNKRNDIDKCKGLA